MYSRAQLPEAGKAAADALATQREWVHRRVEKITFPAPDEPVYRRHVSVDFTIPADLLPVQPEVEVPRFYIPLSLVLKWPPLLRLDLRNAEGRPIPFLTGSQNASLDEAVLSALATQVAGPNLSDEIYDAIKNVTKDRDAARDGLRYLLPSPAELEMSPNLDTARRLLRESPIFVGTAGGLTDSTFLWLRVAGRPGDREIVKFSYDIPMSVEVGNWSAPSFGFRAFIADFDSPHIGSSSSYHLTISAPSPIKVIDSEIKLHRAPETLDSDGDPGELVCECAAKTSPQKKDGLTLYTEPVGDQGRFYLTGERSNCRGKARVALIADKTFAKNAALAAFLIASLVTAYSVRLEQVLELNEAAITLALAAPALLAYLLVRPAQHEFARSFTTGIRRTLALSGLLPILGATALVLSGGCYSNLLQNSFESLSSVSWLTFAVLFLSAILPAGKRARPLSSYVRDDR